MNYIKDVIFEFLFNRLNRIKVYSDLENEHKFIYIHIPKTGGNGILKSLFDVKNGLGHKPLNLYYSANKSKFNNYYKFTIVRNPYSRFVSAFNYLKNGGIVDVDVNVFKNKLEKFSNVNEFIQGLKVDPQLMITVMNYIHFKPQLYFLEGNIRGNSIDHIGKQEEMSASFTILKSQFNLKAVELKKYNITSGYNDRLTNESKIFLYQMYKDDFIYFNYPSDI